MTAAPAPPAASCSSSCSSRASMDAPQNRVVGFSVPPQHADCSPAAPCDAQPSVKRCSLLSAQLLTRAQAHAGASSDRNEHHHHDSSSSSSSSSSDDEESSCSDSECGTSCCSDDSDVDQHWTDARWSGLAPRASLALSATISEPINIPIPKCKEGKAVYYQRVWYRQESKRRLQTCM